MKHVQPGPPSPLFDRQASAVAPGTQPTGSTHPRVPQASPNAPGASTPPADTFVREEDRERLGEQNEVILAALRRGERLTAKDAAHRYGVWRMSARAWDLRQAGHPVKSDYDGTQKCAVYWIDAPTQETKR